MLYGFLTEEERRLFLLLRKVPRVGPQKALALLSHFAADQLVQLIHTGNAAAIATVKGIGKKLAQQILIDLQSALRDFSPSSASPGYQDAYEALLALGFAPAEAHTRLQAAQKVAPEGSAEALLQLALRNP
jgi:Holliday junction DNA helicase RuvA